MPEQRDPIEIVRRYLEASAARRLDEAKSFLADGVELVFPEGRFASLEELVASASRRYRWVKKAYQEWDVVTRADGSAVVTSVGTLHGENLYGVPFEGVRYIDRFIVRDGKITSQQVWNDLAESGVLTQTRR